MYSHLSAGCLNVAPLTFNFIGLLVVLSGQGKQKAPLFSVCLCLIATLWSLPAEAHRSYESYLTFRMDDQPALVWEIETNNFETLFNLDDNGNEIISWGEILAHQDELLAYAFEHINLTFDEQALALEVQQVVVNRKDDQTYLIVHLDLPDAFRPQVLGIEYRLFFDVDKQQRLLLNIQSNLEGAVYPLSPQKTQLEVDIKTNNLWFQVVQFTREGIHHLFEGTDHIAFLLMLVLARFSLQHDIQTVRAVALSLFKLVTAFSIAHTTTLFLAAMGWVRISVSLVELAIALTVVFAAVANISGRAPVLSWQMAFVFGLIHGFGFANVLAEINLQQEQFIVLLLSFNLGLEIAQLLLMLAVFPLLFWLRKFARWYGRLTTLCSGATVLLALSWVVQRI